MTQPPKRLRAKGLDRAFDVIELLHEARGPKRPAEIATALGAPKSTIYEIVGDLVARGLLEATDDEGRVFLGRRLFFWGQAYIDSFDIAQKAGRKLREVTGATKETTQFCMLDGNKYTVLMMQEGARPFRISADVGVRTPIPWTASGRLLVGHLGDAEILDFIPEGDFRLPDGQSIDRGAFLAEVALAREQDFFSFDSIVDNFTHCFAAPIRNEDRVCTATLCIVAPKDDATDRYATYRDLLQAASRDLSGGLF